MFDKIENKSLLKYVRILGSFEESKYEKNECDMMNDI